MWRVFLVFFCAMQFSWGGEDNGARAQGILAEADAAMRAMEALSYQFEYRGNGIMAGEFTGSVTLARADTFAGGALLVRLQSSTADDGSRATDLTIGKSGDRLLLLDRTERTVRAGRFSRGNGHLWSMAYYAVWFQYFNDHPLKVERTAESARWLRRERVGDVTCDVVELKQNIAGPGGGGGIFHRKGRVPTTARLWQDGRVPGVPMAKPSLLRRMTNAAPILAIRFYRTCISPLFPPTCRFEPSCSAYGLKAFRVHGFWKAGLLTAWRILRCNPFNPGGYDPVPPEDWKLGQKLPQPDPSAGEEYSSSCEEPSPTADGTGTGVERET